MHMDGPTKAASVLHFSKATSGMTRRDFLRGVAAGSAATTIPLASLGRVSSAVAAGPRGQTVDVTLITAPDLPYPHVPTQEEQDTDPAAKAYAQAIQPWLDENPGVKLEEISFDVYDQETLLVAIAGGTAPSFYPADVLFTWDEERVLAQEKSGMAADVTAQVEQYGLEEKLTDYSLSVWKTKEIDGRHYALPYSYNCGDGIHYRIDHLQEAGLAEPSPTWTWPDLREMAKTLTNENRKGITLQDWGFDRIWVAEGWDFMTQLPAPDTSWNWKYDYTSRADEWERLISWGREMVYQDESVLRDIAMEDDEIVAQFIGGTASMMNNNVGYHCTPPSDPDGMAYEADGQGKPIQEMFGFIAHPIGTNGYNQTTYGQLDTMGFNPDLDATALDKATSLHVYMMGPGMVVQKKAAFAETNDLRYVWVSDILLPIYKPSEIEGVPGSPDEAWGKPFMDNVRAAAAIPLQPYSHWFIGPQAEAGPPLTPYEDARSKWFFEGGNQDIRGDLQNMESTRNQQAADFTSEVADDKFVAGVKEYYKALDTYFQTNAPGFYADVYKPWYDQSVAPTLG
jgi:ABC-type glycerol-3-phosphate transport system substrate-binding protein